MTSKKLIQAPSLPDEDNWVDDYRLYFLAAALDGPEKEPELYHKIHDALNDHLVLRWASFVRLIKGIESYVPNGHKVIESHQTEPPTKSMHNNRAIVQEPLVAWALSKKLEGKTVYIFDMVQLRDVEVDLSGEYKDENVEFMVQS